jgi:hypothetical protein
VRTLDGDDGEEIDDAAGFGDLDDGGETGEASSDDDDAGCLHEFFLVFHRKLLGGLRPRGCDCHVESVLIATNEVLRYEQGREQKERSRNASSPKPALWKHFTVQRKYCREVAKRSLRVGIADARVRQSNLTFYQDEQEHGRDKQRIEHLEEDLKSVVVGQHVIHWMASRRLKCGYGLDGTVWPPTTTMMRGACMSSSY